MKLSAEEFEMLRHPNEPSRLALAIVVLIFLSVIAVGLVVLTYGGIILAVLIVLAVVWFGQKILIAHFMTNLVRVSRASFPEVHKAVCDAKELFGYEGKVEAYILEEGSYNLIIYPLLKQKLLLIHSGILTGKTYEKQMRFMVARFVGALATKKYRFFLLQVLLSTFERLFLFNFLLFPYERAAQYTGDRMGLRMIEGDVDTAVNALMRMAVGSELARRTHPLAYVNQYRSERWNLFVWLARALSRFPHHCQRVESLILHGQDLYRSNTSAFLKKYGATMVGGRHG